MEYSSAISLEVIIMCNHVREFVKETEQRISETEVVGLGDQWWYKWSAIRIIC